MLVCMCPYAFCVCHTQDSSVRVGNLLYGDIRYVNGGVRVTVTRLKDGDEVSGDEEDETNEKTKKKQGGKKKVILWYTCVLILTSLCPYAFICVSLFFNACVLMLICMCPYSLMHVSLFFDACVLIRIRKETKKKDKTKEGWAEQKRTCVLIL